jgi:hypothetical protein
MADKMIRCAEGHFYDSAKHPACPWCGVPVDTGAGRTRALAADAAAAAPASGPAQAAGPRPAAPAAGATRALHREASGISPVVGWLVCIEGPDRGRDFRLHSEKNFIGRSASMDVAIAGDDSISREKHACVSYEPKKKVFWLLPGEASGLVYLNEDVVNGPTELKPRGVIELGRTKLMFFPLCDEHFQWQ